MTYIVNKPFTYQGLFLARGDTWSPSGHRNDKAIIVAKLVREETPKTEATAPVIPVTPRGRRVPG